MFKNYKRQFVKWWDIICIIIFKNIYTPPPYSEIPLPSDGFLLDLLEPWDVRALSIRKTADLPLQLWVDTYPRFVAIGFYFLSETLI
jgi:hypothetical protein